jgi:hypothetical protein
MIDLKSFLEAYESNVSFFDIDVFEDDVMDIPYQIETLDKNFDKLTATQREKFIKITNLLDKKVKNIIPANIKRKDILEIIKQSISSEQNNLQKVA